MLLLALGERPGVFGQRGAERRALKPRTAAAQRRGQLLDLPVAEPHRVERVEDHQIDLELVAIERRAQADGLVHRHFLGGRDRDYPGEIGVGDRGRDRPALMCDRADPGDLGKRPGGAEQPDAVAGGGGVDDHEVVRSGPAGAALKLGELPNLADRQQLAHPRRCHRERLEQAARAERVADRAELDPEVLVHRVLGVD